MDYKEIISNTDKYYYFVVTQNKTVLISSSNTISDVKKLALEKLQPNIVNLIGKKLVFVKIKNVSKEYNKQENSEELKIIGGPILFEFERGLIKSAEKIHNYNDIINNKVYLSDKYIKKYQDNIAFNLKKLVSDFVTKKFNQGLLAMTIL